MEDNYYNFNNGTTSTPTDTNKIKPAPLWQKLLFYFLFFIVVISVLIGVFILLILIIRTFRAHIPIQFIPWIFAGVYLVSVMIVVIILNAMYKKIKDNNKWKKYFISLSSKKN